MLVSVTYAEPIQQLWLELQVPDEATVMEAIRLSGLLERFPEIDLKNQKVGIFGKVAKLETLLSEGDRVEIYRPITADPATVPRKDEE